MYQARGGMARLLGLTDAAHDAMVLRSDPALRRHLFSRRTDTTELLNATLQLTGVSCGLRNMRTETEQPSLVLLFGHNLLDSREGERLHQGDQLDRPFDGHPHGESRVVVHLPPQEELGDTVC